MGKKKNKSKKKDKQKKKEKQKNQQKKEEEKEVKPSMTWKDVQTLAKERLKKHKENERADKRENRNKKKNNNKNNDNDNENDYGYDDDDHEGLLSESTDDEDHDEHDPHGWNHVEALAKKRLEELRKRKRNFQRRDLSNNFEIEVSSESEEEEQGKGKGKKGKKDKNKNKKKNGIHFEQDLSSKQNSRNKKKKNKNKDKRRNSLEVEQDLEGIAEDMYADMEDYDEKEAKKWRKKQNKKKNKQSRHIVSATSVHSYNILHPDRTLWLPNGQGHLSEVSGVVYDPTTKMLLAIEDEQGLLSSFNPEERPKEIEFQVSLSQARFAEEGDFEDIAVDGNHSVWAVRSDGTLYHIKDSITMILHGHDSSDSEIYSTHLTYEDNVEGLCWDPVRKVLLLACKADDLKESEKRVYAFDVDTKTLSDEPVFTVSLEEVEAVAKGLGEKKPKALKWCPSALAVSPLEPNHIFMIGTKGRRLVVVNNDGDQVLYTCPLPRDVYTQPEGITFGPDDTLYIASEGRLGEGGPGKGYISQINVQKW